MLSLTPFPSKWDESSVQNLSVHSHTSSAYVFCAKVNKQLHTTIKASSSNKWCDIENFHSKI